jgi:hypothetical protein
MIEPINSLIIGNPSLTGLWKRRPTMHRQRFIKPFLQAPRSTRIVEGGSHE